MDSARKLTWTTWIRRTCMKDAETWELVVRKLRAGMMPPPGMKRPDPPVYKAMIALLESELDRDVDTLHAAARPSPTEPHRIRERHSRRPRPRNRRGKYLPNDDSTHGFDNIAGALGLSSTLVEAYVSAAQKISRLAIGDAEAAHAGRVPNP